MNFPIICELCELMGIISFLSRAALFLIVHVSSWFASMSDIHGFSLFSSAAGSWNRAMKIMAAMIKGL